MRLAIVACDGVPTVFWYQDGIGTQGDEFRSGRISEKRFPPFLKTSCNEVADDEVRRVEVYLRKHDS